MNVDNHYHEVAEVLHHTFRDVFVGLEREYAEDLATIRTQYPREGRDGDGEDDDRIVITKEPCIRTRMGRKGGERKEEDRRHR